MRILLAAAFSLILIGAPAFAQEGEPICRPLTTSNDADVRGARARHGAQTWVFANGAARQRPEREGFDAARYVYTYAPGALYELYANPNFISTILLEPGETLENVAAGDTARWQVSQANAEGAFGPRPMLMVKPSAMGLRTNIVLVTDRRTYLVEAVSQGEAYSAEIAWCYPARASDQLIRTDPGALNFEYQMRTIRGRRPAWTPLRVYDDGRRTWIEFSAETIASDLPPIFVLTGEGAELVNYRVDGRRYVLDRTFEAAELRLGVRAPVVVRIERRSPAPTRNRGRGR